MRRLVVSLCVAVAWVAPAFAAGTDPWALPGWEARRTFKITGTRSPLPGDEIGVVEFYTDGRARADAADVRVLAGNRKERPFRVLQSGPGDRLRLVFPLVKDETRYDVYYGKAEAKRSDASLASFKIQRGVLLEVRRYRGGDPASLAKMQEIWKRAGPMDGRDFVPRIYFGYNPFGPDTRYVARYRGWLVATEAGEYTFVTSSDDASFLLVDGKPIVSWPGWHGAVGDARHAGKIKLNPGLYPLDYWHVNGDAQGIAVAAWRPPGARRVEPIPAESFAPVRAASHRGFAVKGKARPAFEPVNAGEAWVDEKTPLVRMRFRAVDAAGRPERCTWMFGDGLSSEGSETEHRYLAPGEYAVSFTTRSGYTASNRVRVEPLPERSIRRRTDRIELALAEAARYDLAKLDTPGLTVAARLFREKGTGGQALAAARALLARSAGIKARALHDAARSAAHVLRERSPEGALEARALLEKAELDLRDREGAEAKRARAKLLREIGDASYYYLDDLDAARVAYDRIVTGFRGVEPHLQRVAKIRLGDIHRDRGEYDEAARRYEAAEAMRTSTVRKGETLVRAGALAHSVSTALARGKLEEASTALEIWEWEYPTEKLRGQSTLLRARLERARARPEEAAKQLEILVRVNPESAYAPEALMTLARIRHKAGALAAARAAWSRVAGEHRDSDLAGEATRLLQETASAAEKE